MPYEGERPATPDELKARGLLPQGPLSPPMDPKTPMANEQAIKDQKVNQVVQAGQQAVGRIMQVPPGTQTIPMPGPLGYMAQNARKNAPQIGGMVGGTLMPGPGLLGVAGRVLGAGGLSGLGAFLTGKDPKAEALAGAGGQLGGEALAGGARLAGNTVLRNQFAKEQAEKVADLLKSKVPALGKFGSDAKSLSQMVYGSEAQNAVRTDFDKALKAGVAKAKEQGIRVPISLEDAERIGLQTGGLGALEELRGQPAKNIRALLPSMPADEVADKIVGWWKKDPALYRRVTDALDSVGVGDPKARAAYKYYTGFSNYADKTKMLANEQFWPERAMGGKTGSGIGGLGDTKQVNELRKRGMGDMMSLLRGPGASPMTSRNTGQWERRFLGGAIGEGLGMLGTGSHGFGVPGLAGGAMGDFMIPKTIYHNTPLTPGVKSGMEGGATFLGQLGRNFMQTVSSS